MSMHRLFALSLATAVVACAHREWRPKLDARCDCEGAAPRTSVVRSSGPEAIATAPGMAPLGADRMIAYLQANGVADPVVLSYASESSFYKGPIQAIFERRREEATAAAEAATQTIANDLAAELATIRRELLFLKKSGDADGVADAKSRLWLRLEEGIAVLREEATMAAQTRIPLPKDAILFWCHFQPETTMSSGQKVRAGDACDVRAPADLDRFVRARDEFVDSLVAPIIAKHRHELVIVMNQ